MLYFKVSQRTLGTTQSSQKQVDELPRLISLGIVLPCIHCIWFSRVLHALSEFSSKCIWKLSDLHRPLPSAQLPSTPKTIIIFLFLRGGKFGTLHTCLHLTVSVNLEPTWCFWMLFHYLPRARSSRWMEKTPLMAFLTCRIPTVNPALLIPLFLSGWTFWLLLALHSTHKDRLSLEMAPWRKGAQVRCLHNWELAKATEPESPVWDFVLDTPRVSQFPYVAKVIGSWRSRGKQTGIPHTSSILLAREDHMAKFSSPVWCSPVGRLGEVPTFIDNTIKFPWKLQQLTLSLLTNFKPHIPNQCHSKC